MSTPNFIETTPSRDNFWRSVILFGQNVASYKFALGSALLDLAGRPNDLIKLEDLALPFARRICDHLKHSDKQATSPTSRFLKACRDFNAGRLTDSQLVAQTAKLGFVNVIDAFHVVNQAEVPIRFFVDERQTSGGIRITDELRRLREDNQFGNLPHELEARWRLVETAWELNLPRTVLVVQYDEKGESLVVETEKVRRRKITGCRSALNGYQKGRCFYCRAEIDVASADIDHFIAHTTAVQGARIHVDGVWNLVLACRRCNRGEDGKFARVPTTRFLERLHQRNEYFITSHHPLRETLINQTGRSVQERGTFLQRAWTEARALLIHTWEPRYEEAVIL